MRVECLGVVTPGLGKALCQNQVKNKPREERHPVCLSKSNYNYNALPFEGQVQRYPVK
jgi:hypothetical protein